MFLGRVKRAALGDLVSWTTGAAGAGAAVGGPLGGVIGGAVGLIGCFLFCKEPQKRMSSISKSHSKIGQYFRRTGCPVRCINLEMPFGSPFI